MPSSLTLISIDTGIESNFQFGKTNKTPKIALKTLDFFGPNKIFYAVSSLLDPTHFLKNTILNSARYAWGSVLSNFGIFSFKLIWGNISKYYEKCFFHGIISITFYYKF
jgi:hypothetical protein